MGRFSDEWLIDRTLFDYVQGGSCACCSFANFMPNGTAGLIESMNSELETDAVNQEVAALNTIPWPPDMRDQVWMERVRLRQKLKMDMKRKYKAFWDDHGDAYCDWFRNASPTTIQRLHKIFQLPRSQISEHLKDNYNIHAAFGTVLCAVIEQVANFPMTGYPDDGRGEAEVAFERALSFGRRGGFGLANMFDTDTDGKTVRLNPDVVQTWLDRQKTLGGPKLLDRAAPKTIHKDANGDSDEEDGGGGPNDDPDIGTTSGGIGPSFRADRRVVRLLIARHWADLLQKMYLAEMEQKSENPEVA